jgi:hypothetical protein
MRLFGTTINTGVWARTEANKAYYRLNPGFFNVNGNDTIILDKSKVSNENIPRVWLSGKWVSLSGKKNHIIRIKEGNYKLILKDEPNNIFRKLQNFRNQKGIGNDEKINVASDVGEEIVEMVI